MNNPILDFLKEIFIRLGADSPKFFKVIKWIAAAAALITGLPAFIDFLGVTLPDWAIALESKTVAIAAAIAAFIAALPVKNDPEVIVATSDAEAEVIETKLAEEGAPKSLPFTDKH